MISYEEALDVLMKAEKLSSTTTVKIEESCGHTVAETIVSNISVPSFANSAMDGFAVRYTNLVNASNKNPVTLKVAGSVATGDISSPPSSMGGDAWEIMTGAPVPEGYDAVVKLEDITIDKKNVQDIPEKITLIQPVCKKNNIRNVGEDFLPGDTIIENNTTITPMHVMALAAIGQKNIAVIKKPRVTVFITGKEVVDDADIELLPGQIHNSNGPYLNATLGVLGITTYYGGILDDDPKLFEDKVKQILEKSNIIISTGAVSMGRHDFIPNSLRKLGAKILFHKVAIRPGKPVLYARFADGTHYFGLPGNPASAAVGLRFFVMPLLRNIQGIKPELPITTHLLSPFSKKQRLRFFCKAYVSVSLDGKLQLKILKGQESFKIHSLIRANCWATFSQEQISMEERESIDIFPFIPGMWYLENVSKK